MSGPGTLNAQLADATSDVITRARLVVGAWKTYPSVGETGLATALRDLEMAFARRDELSEAWKAAHR